MIPLHKNNRRGTFRLFLRRLKRQAYMHLSLYGSSPLYRLPKLRKQTL